MEKMTNNTHTSKEKKTTVAILFGGQSAEHDVSLESAKALYHYIDREKFTPMLIHIARKDGKWRLIDEKRFLAKDFLTSPSYSFLPWLNNNNPELDADIYFPMLHGPNGEDGKIQSLLELADKPYVGANSLSSALAMDKVVAKILFRHAGLNVVDFLYFENHDTDTIDTIHEAIIKELGFPVFVKPSAMGSSVGISKVDNPAKLPAALDLAFRYDRKILIEKAVNIREIEVSVMGNDQILVSRPGELFPHNEFYDYNDKYIEGKTIFQMPAILEPKQEEEVRRISGQAFKTLFLNGMARVDLFIEKNTGTIYVNELNTIPGFTQISMFPKLWSLQDISFTQLITHLIDYGFQYHQQHKISTDRE